MPERLLQGTGRAKAQPAVAGWRPAEPADNEVRPTEYPGLREQQAPRSRRRRNRRRLTRGLLREAKEEEKEGQGAGKEEGAEEEEEASGQQQ